MDHCPIWLDTIGTKNLKQSPKPFQFEVMWVGKECHNIIEQVWHLGKGGGSVRDIIQMLLRCGSHLKQWNMFNFGNVQRCLMEANLQLKMVQKMSPNHTSVERLAQARKEVHVWLKRDEKMWKQRSRILWLKEGDRNSKIFHAKASNRRK